MKAHKTTLSVRELQKTIGQWKSRKITDSTIAKLLELMLGMTAYMNEDAVYPVENFYDISKALKFKNARYLVEAVRLSGARHRTRRQCVRDEFVLFPPLERERKNG